MFVLARGAPLRDASTLRDYGIANGDKLELTWQRAATVPAPTVCCVQRAGTGHEAGGGGKEESLYTFLSVGLSDDAWTVFTRVRAHVSSLHEPAERRCAALYFHLHHLPESRRYLRFPARSTAACPLLSLPLNAFHAFSLAYSDPFSLGFPALMYGNGNGQDRRMRVSLLTLLLFSVHLLPPPGCAFSQIYVRGCLVFCCCLTRLRARCLSATLRRLSPGWTLPIPLACLPRHAIKEAMGVPRQH